jgi:competence ComEA-like helix-hairpin-helix protein
MTGIILLPGIISVKKDQPLVLQDTAWLNAVKQLEVKNPETSEEETENNEPRNFQIDRTKNSYVYTETPQGELFYFDPNTLSEAGWKKLGLKEKTIRTIQNYLNKNGHFYKPEDLKKIYGLRQNEYERLFPFVRIEPRASNNIEEFTEKKKPQEFQSEKKHFAGYSIIDVNSADTAAFISLPGIGSKLAARIVKFRENLGGFYSIDQVAETYGLPDSTFQKIRQYLKLENTSVKKININTVTVDELKAHPYIKYSMANPIVAYRNEHGPYARVEDIKKVMVVTEEIYMKIAPYLTVQ